MRRHITIRAVVVLIVTAVSGLLFAPCAFFNDSLLPEYASDDSGTPTAKLAPNTLYIDDIPGLTLISAEDGRYVYTFEDVDPEITAGSILLSGRGAGYLRKVVSVVYDGKTIECLTEQAVLTEAFESLDISHTVLLTPMSVETQEALAKGVHLPKIISPSKASLGTFTIGIGNVVVYDLDGNTATTNDQVTLSGSISFSPTITFSAKIEDFTLERVYFTVGMNEQASVSANAKVRYAVEKEIELAKYTFGTIVISTPWPVTLTPVLTVKAGISGSAEGSMTVSITQDATFTAGVQYDAGSWQPVMTSGIDFGFNPPSLSVGANAKAYAGPDLSLMIYGVAGPYVSTEGYLKLEASPMSVPWWALYAGLNIGAGAKIEVFSYTIADYSVDLLDYRILLAGASSTCKDADGDGYFNEAGCGSAIVDCDDDDPYNWISCLTCVDLDGDNRYVSCDIYPGLGPDCDDDDPSNWNSCDTCVDADGDGYFVDCDTYDFLDGPDCDDGDPSVWESCDSCRDEDGDGYYVDCDDYSHFEHEEIDCDDTNHFVHPGADELCDGIDNQCPGDAGYGVIDEGCIQLGSAKKGSGFEYHNCAITEGDVLSCWGRNKYGELGDGTTTDHIIPGPVFGMTSVSAVAAGLQHTCAVKSDGSAWCWGRNSLRQLGNGTTGDSSYPVRVINNADGTELTGATGIAVGHEHGCVTTDQGGRELRCWGWNSSYQLGQGNSIIYNAAVSVKRDLEGNPLTGVMDVACGYWHTCALMGDGKIKCWGSSAYGQIGSSVPLGEYASIPVDVPEISGAVAIAAGQAHTCALLEDSTVTCWGNNTHLALGSGTVGTNYRTPRPVPGIADAVAVSAKWFHTCAMISDGTMKCWGYNYRGQTGAGDRNTPKSPVLVVGTDFFTDPTDILTGIRGISAASQFACAFTADGAMWCWGANAHGMLGDGRTTNGDWLDYSADSLVPVRVIGIGPGP